MKKYRPYLTLADLKRLADLSRSDSQVHPITQYLDRYILDIDSGWRKPNSISEPNMSEKLGFTPPEPETIYDSLQKTRYLSGQMSPTEEKDYEISQGRTV